MKLYPKKLNSVEELKHEKIRLKFEKLHTKTSDLLPIKELTRGRKSKRSSSSNLLGLTFDVMNSKSSVQTALMLAGPVLNMLKGKKKSALQPVLVKAPRKSLLRSVVHDILICYITGKGVQLGIHAVGMYFRSRNKKKLRLLEAESERNRGW